MKTTPALAAATLALLLAGGAASAPPPDSSATDVLKRANITLKVNSPVLHDPRFDLPPGGPYDDLDKAVADLKGAADGVKEARKAYQTARETCKTKSYNNQEINAVCAPTDTVEQCGEKLFAHCVALPRKHLTLAIERLQAADVKLDKVVGQIVAGAIKR